MTISTLPVMFLNSVKNYSDKIALSQKIDGQFQGINYETFGNRVKNLALGLATLGTEAGDKVAILSENRPEWAFCDFAILALGAIDVPIYTTLTPGQIEYILDDSETKIIFVSTSDLMSKILKILPNLPNLEYIIYLDPTETQQSNILSFEDIIKLGQTYEQKNPDYFQNAIDKISPHDPASIIYTSGTTGEPKGVVLSHNNFYSNMMGGVSTLKVSANDRLLSFLPLSHVLERTAGFYAPVYSGASIAYAESVELVAQNIIKTKPTIMLSVPRLFEKMHARILENAKSGSAIKKGIFNWALKIGENHIKMKKCGSVNRFMTFKYNLANKLVFKKVQEKMGGELRFFLSGGAPLSKEIGEFFYSMGIKILEGYGLTESSPCIALNVEENPRFGSVGPALTKGGVEVKIAPDGEILARGPNIMLGYYKKPVETKEMIDEEGWLHTGDIGFLTEDNFLVITDRKKSIIVTAGGKNIAPAPIENTMLTSPLIEQIVVIGDRRKFLSAVIYPNVEALKAFANKHKIEFTDIKTFLGTPKIFQYVNNEINRLSSNMARFEQIKKFTLLTEPFTIERGELTPTLKIKRKFVEQKYLKLVDKMYG